MEGVDWCGNAFGPRKLSIRSRTQSIQAEWRFARARGVPATDILFASFSHLAQGYSTYILARYILAFLNLSPSTVVLSDAASGTASPDSLLRMLSLIGVICAALSVAGCVGVAFYLRFVNLPSAVPSREPDTDAPSRPHLCSPENQTPTVGSFGSWPS